MPTLHADRDRLLQVLINLLSNAAKFVPAGQGRVTVTLCRRPREGIEVQDNGPGVPPEQQQLVFEKFRQGGDASNRPQGTGLGLPISRQIIEHSAGGKGHALGAGEIRAPASASSCRDARKKRTTT